MITARMNSCVWFFIYVVHGNKNIFIVIIMRQMLFILWISSISIDIMVCTLLSWTLLFCQQIGTLHQNTRTYHVVIWLTNFYRQTIDHTVCLSYIERSTDHCSAMCLMPLNSLVCFSLYQICFSGFRMFYIDTHKGTCANHLRVFDRLDKIMRSFTISNRTAFSEWVNFNPSTDK